MPSEPEDDTLARPSAPEPSAAPERIGPYKILQILGSGGMGVVYMAEQTEPVKRRVALKLVKLGMDTTEVVARFEAERQALALMDHPGIARVYDAGTAASGRPYFAMELVHGVPFTEYCDSHRLRTRERVALFIEVCRAVQHAHQKGVMHRDLKPSNVLVTVLDDRPVPKVIDFGIAKALDRRLGEGAFVTQIGSAVGTPAYMSPEQLSGSGLDIDTRTDIYSLGVMLYEVLAGLLPREVRGAATDVVNALRTTDEDPVIPSARVSALEVGRQTTISARRGTDTATLRRELKGDLDWITMKAMARDRAQRYDAASALALDLQRYLRNEPIAARPPSTRYRMGKFVRRHRAGVGLAAGAAILVVGFAVAMALQASRVARERDRAEREAARVTALNRFMTDMLGSANPWGEGGKRDVTVVEALQKSADAVDRSFAREPLLAATARQAIGATFLGLGQLDEAERNLQKALETRMAALGPDSSDVADSLQELASLDETRGRYAEAERRQREALAIREKASGPESEPVSDALTRLSNILFAKGEYDEAERAAGRALETARKASGARSAKAAAALLALGNARQEKGDYAPAEAALRECLSIKRDVLGPEHVEVGRTLNDLAVIRLKQNDLKEAESLYREALAVNRKALGDEHPEVASTLENLGGVLYRTGRPKETIELLGEVLAIRKKGLGEDNVAVARTVQNRAVIQAMAGELDAAEAGFRESIPRMKQALGPGHPDMAVVYTSHAFLQRLRKDYAGAEASLREGIAIAVRQLGPNHDTIPRYELELGHVLVLEGRFAEGEPLLQKGLAAAEATSNRRNVRRAVEQLVKVYEATGRAGEAETYRHKLAALPAEK